MAETDTGLPELERELGQIQFRLEKIQAEANGLLQRKNLLLQCLLQTEQTKPELVAAPPPPAEASNTT